MTLEIREMRPEDYEAVSALWAEELGVPEVTPARLAEATEAMRPSGMYHTLVAVQNGCIAGMVTTVDVLAVDCPGGYVKINGLAVRRDLRRRGIGRALLMRVEDDARSRGRYSLGPATGFRRCDAHRFYERLGYRSGSYWYGKRVK